MKLWGKIWKENHLIRDIVVEDNTDDTRTHKFFHSIDQICDTFDLGHPIWLESTIRSFQRRSHARFNADAFVEAVDFDYLEIQVLEE